MEEAWQGWMGSVAGRRGLQLRTWGACPTAPSSVRPARWVLAAVADPILGPDWFLLGAAALKLRLQEACLSPAYLEESRTQMQPAPSLPRTGLSPQKVTRRR